LSTPVAKMAEGLLDDFDQVVREHQKRVYRVAFLLVRDHDTADTVTQECFLRAYNSRKGFRGECSVGTWLLRIAVNLARDHAKNRRASFWKRLVGLETEAHSQSQYIAREPSAEQVLLAREQLQAVWRMTATLSPQQQTIFLLRFAEEMPLAEIAETLGLSVGTVKAHLSRATSAVRQQIRGTS
jgi:RNA polymerase sigma-70 factor (ECF subfamily)